jgi:hypothetical protein
VIHRVPAKGGFSEAADIHGAGGKRSGIGGQQTHIALHESVSVLKGEWIEIDDELMTCRLCAELNGVRVSRTLEGKWTHEEPES